MLVEDDKLFQTIEKALLRRDWVYKCIVGVTLTAEKH